jgi:flavin-dependent dehydrogenase
VSGSPASPQVLVVGGGPVGLAAAIACRSRGLEVTVLEARSAPLDKACGEGLLPEGVALLRRAGVALEGAGAPFAGIRWCDDRSTVLGRFADAPGLGVRRTELHGRLLARAAAVGVDVRFGVRVRGLARAPAGFGVRTSDGPYEPRWLLAADGLDSPLRRAARLEGAPATRRRLAVRRHFLVEEDTARAGCDSAARRFVEVWWGEGVEAYLTPVGGGTIGVALLWHERGVQRSGGGKRFDSLLDSLLERFPELRSRLAAAKVASRDRGAGPLRRRARAVYRDNLALVGDAAGYVDAITGEGLSLGFHQAAALAEALAGADLRSYARAVRSLRRVPDALTELCLLLSRRPALRTRTLAALAREPRLFDRLLALHVREAEAAAPLAARLLWRVATVRLVPVR